jgi:hypothetical protein
MAGAAKFTAHGSGGGGVLGGGGVDAAGVDAGADVVATGLVVVGCGVLATVESPDPQPASTATAAQIVIKVVTASRTPGTVPGSVDSAPQARRPKPRGTRLPNR